MRFRLGLGACSLGDRTPSVRPRATQLLPAGNEQFRGIFRADGGEARGVLGAAPARRRTDRLWGFKPGGMSGLRGVGRVLACSAREMSSPAAAIRRRAPRGPLVFTPPRGVGGVVGP